MAIAPLVTSDMTVAAICRFFRSPPLPVSTLYSFAAAPGLIAGGSRQYSICPVYLAALMLRAALMTAATHSAAPHTAITIQMTSWMMARCC